METPGGFKVCWSVSTDTIAAPAARQVWDAYVAFAAHADAKKTFVNLERYNTVRARAVDPAANAVGPAVRSMPYHCFAGAVYSDPALHGEAETLGHTFRRLLAAGAEKPTL